MKRAHPKANSSWGQVRREVNPLDPDTDSVCAENSMSVQDSNIIPLGAQRKTASAPVRAMVERIFHKYHRILMKFLRDSLFDKDEVEDVAQEVYYRISRRPDLDKIDYPKAFLMRTARNLLIDMNRCRRTQQAEVSPATKELANSELISADTPESMLGSEELLNTLQVALAELSPKCQAVFVMQRIDGIPYKQIASELNLSLSMVEKYMRQALKHLKERTEESHVE